MTLFFTSFKQMLILFTFIGIGFLFKKKGFLPSGADGTIATLENNLLMPALIVNTFLAQCTIENLSKKGGIFLAGIIVLVITVGISYILAKLFDKEAYTQNVYRYSFAFPNIGFMGIAVVQGIGGLDLLFDYMIFTLPYNAFIYSVGVTWLLPGGKFQLKALINPMFIAMAIGILLGLSSIVVPDIILSTISSLAACMSPLAMLLTGYVIAKFDLSNLLKIKKVYVASSLRLLLIPLTAFAIFELLRIPNSIILPAICALAMPMGLNTIVIPTAHGLDVDLGASMALISSVAAIFTIPMVFAVIL